MIDITPFQPSDYEEAMALWQRTEGLTLRAADSCEAVLRYLKRNPGSSFVAREQDTLVAAVLGGLTCATRVSCSRATKLEPGFRTPSLPPSSED